ncbi:MAG: hypothetical protein KDN22_30830 [Verrucomicrobiae bacterium]|nr:hypothetical protein [Verrucomicrobiae bacterium]
MVAKFLLHVAALATLSLVSCSGSSEATTRKDQEIEFTRAFGLSPSASITQIAYSDLYNRGVMDGAYGQWMRFTFEKETFEKIVGNGYSMAMHPSLGNKEVSPAWWPKSIAPRATVYTRTHEDTPENEGFSFDEILWHDSVAGFVYYHKLHWD